MKITDKPGLPTFLVDMDGPLAAFDKKYFDLAATNGWPMDADLDTQVHRFASGHILDSDHRKQATAIVNSSGWFRDLPVVDGAAEGMWRLHQVANVWICTKPLEANPTCRDEKGAWLAEHFGEEWLDRLIITPNKAMVRGDLLLDDAPHIGWLEHAEWKSIIYPTPYNRTGSEWSHLPEWSWDRDVDELLDHIR